MSKFIKSKKYVGVSYCLLKNKDKSYYISYKLNGKYKRLHIGKQSEGVNESFCHQKRIEAINNIKFGDDSPIVNTKKKEKLFDEIAEIYFEYSEVHNKDYKNQRARYEKHIKPYTRDLAIDEITPELIEKMMQDKKKKLALKTINHLVQAIGTIYNHAFNRDVIKIPSPTRLVKKFKTNNERLRYLCLEEIHELYEELKDNEQLYLFTRLALNTGARLKAITTIKKKDLDLENKIVSLRDYKNESYYRGFLQDDIVNILKKRASKLRSNDYILMYDTKVIGNLDDYISRKMKPVLDGLFNKDLDIKDTRNRVVIHTLRHTFASHLAINGTPIFTIQKLMNHKDIKQTMRYAKLSPDSGKEFINRLYK
ncbi:MAG: tyrosine-type recombinase/integrase [Halarcobacter sp.]